MPTRRVLIVNISRGISPRSSRRRHVQDGSRDDKIKKLTDELERLKKIDLERQATPIKK
jgi:hypothetical protein